MSVMRASKWLTSSLCALLERTNCTTYGEADTRRDGSVASILEQSAGFLP